MTVTLDGFIREPPQEDKRPAPQQAPALPVGPWQLRPYQIEAVEAWRSAGYRGVVVAPTGTGKTVIAIAALREARPHRAVIVVPTERILKVWTSALRKGGFQPGVFYGRRKSPDSITVTIYNSAITHPEIIGGADMVILDEIHHAAAEKFSLLLKALPEGTKVLGLTATLLREDGKQSVITSRLPVVYYLAPSDALQQGYLAPIRIIPIPAPLTQADRQQYSSIENQIREVRRRLKDVQTLGYDGRVRELDKKLKILYNRRRQLLSKIPSKREKVLEIIRQNGGEDRILVFSESIESIEALKTFLLMNGIKAETYHSHKSEEERDRIFSEWGGSFSVLLAVRALDEGVDVPEVKVGVIIASGKSYRQLVQRKGRLVRPAHNKEARLYVVYAEMTYEFEIFLRLSSLLKGSVRLY